MSTDPYEDNATPLCFLSEDRRLVTELMAIMRLLPQRKDVSPETISKLGVILAALERLPSTTLGFSASLTLQYDFNRSFRWLSLSLNEESFILQKGNHEYDPDVGGDTHSENILEITQDSRHGWDCDEFLESFGTCARDRSYRVITEIHNDPSC
jgi:hypothetical protein